MISVTISGSHSTGKTTLVNELKKKLPSWNVLSETARKVINKENIIPKDIEKDIDKKIYFQKEIINSQIQEEILLRKKGNNFICDRGIFDPIGYGNNLPKSIKMALEYKILRHYKKNPYNLVLFLPPILDIEDDGTRIMTKDFQKEVSDTIESSYIKNNITYYKLNTLILDERVEKSLDIIKKLK